MQMTGSHSTGHSINHLADGLAINNKGRIGGNSIWLANIYSHNVQGGSMKNLSPDKLQIIRKHLRFIYQNNDSNDDGNDNDNGADKHEDDDDDERRRCRCWRP